MKDFKQYIDLTEFTTEVGYTAVIRYCINKNIDSFYCGYVQVPKESVLHGLHWHEDPTDILQIGTDEGDSWIDWSGDMSNLMGRPDTLFGIWSFGFDTLHPSWTTSRLAAELSKGDNLTVATYDYVKNICEILAKRLKIIHDNNPVDQQPTEPAKETEKMELPFEDINNKIQGLEKRLIKLEDMLSPCRNAIAKPKTVEAPIEPERVSIKEFKKDPHGKFYTLDGVNYKEFIAMETVGEYAVLLFDIYEAGHPIYATDPTAWLAWKAEQEGKSQ